MDTSYLSQQVTTIIERLHVFFDEIGVPSHDRDSRESELFSALSETLHNQLNLVAKEKHDLTEEATRLIKTIRQMEHSIDDTRADDEFETARDCLEVSFPLLKCLQGLKEKHHTVSKLHRERYEQVKKLVEALESYASHLEPSFVTLTLPPIGANAKVPPNFDLSPTYVGKLDQEFTRVYEEYNHRVEAVTQLAQEIISLWSELGTPQAQIDSHIVNHARESPEQLGLHQDDLNRLIVRRDKLVSEKQQRERKLKELRANVASLWDRLGIDETERKQFLSANRGCGMRQINEFENQLAHLNELKRQNLHIFVEDARVKLQELWDGLYFSEEEMLEFTPAFSDVYSDALLCKHEQEIARLETLKEQRGPILAAVDRYRSLIQDRSDLETSSLDASRLLGKGGKGEKRDPGKLLREEKMRKRIAKELPKLEAELRRTLEAWEDEYHRPFLVHGERYLDEIGEVASKPVPPRSKTPNALAPAREPPKSAGRSQMPSKAGNHNTLRGAPPPRSKTPTAHPRTAMAASTSALVTSKHGTTKLSPSKIPAATSRLPMSTMADGSNSPERRLKAAHSQATLVRKANGLPADAPAALRPMMVPPPPRMKDLFVSPTPMTTSTVNTENGWDAEQHSANVVRHVDLDDPYDDSVSNRYISQPPTHHPSSTSQQHTSMAPPASRAPLYHQDYPVAPPSRQASQTSSVMSSNGISAGGGSQAGSTVSGSENWETYTDNSDVDEADATEAYRAKVKAQQQVQYQQQQQMGFKRSATAMQGAQVKRIRPPHVQQPIYEGGGGGSEEGWTDDGDVGDTY